MFATSVIYTILWLSLYIALKGRESAFNRSGQNRSASFWTIGLIFVLMLACLIKGLSYDMGTDYLEYVNIYKRISRFGFHSHEKLEIGYVFLNKILAFFQLNLPWIFIVNSFIVFYSLLYLASQLKHNVAISVVLWFFFLYIMSNNLWRQYDAMGFMMIAFTKLIQTDASNEKKFIAKKLLGFTIFSGIACLFHKTAIIYFIVFLLLWTIRKKHLNVLIILGAITISFIYTAAFVQNSNMTVLSTAMELMGYSDTYTLANKFEEYTEYSVLSEIKEYIVHVFTILAGDYILRKDGENYKYRLFYYATVFYFILYPFGRFHSVFVRLILYAQMLIPFYYGLTLYYLKKEQKRSLVARVYKTAIYFMLFLFFVDFYQYIASSTESIGHGYMLYQF